MKLLLVITILIAHVSQGHAFSSWMTSDFCRRELRVGELIMNEEVVLSEDRVVEVYRDGAALRSNYDHFVLGETLTVKISTTNDQYVYEVSGNKEARFVNGGCNGRRIADKKEVQLDLPKSNTQDSVSVVVAWAEGHTTVKLSQPFILLSPDSALSTTAHQTLVSPHNNSIDIKDTLVSASNLRGREGELHHSRSKFIVIRYNSI